VTDAEAFLAKLKAHLAEFNADLAASAERYTDPAQQAEAIAEQLYAVLRLVEPWVKPPATLFPLWDHLQKLVERQHSRHGHGADPVRLAETMRRALALVLMELEFLARGRRDEKKAADEAADAYPPFTGGQLINWRKRANSGREPILEAARDQWLAFWQGKYPGEPGKAAQNLKKLAHAAKKVYRGRSI
jgi:hypothetical protein